jgi:hypothetical protein
MAIEIGKLNIEGESFSYGTNKPAPIEMGKKYRTRDGRDVRILCVDANGDRPVVGLINGNVHIWNPDGQYWVNEEFNSDLIEISPYSDIAIDAPGWARDEGAIGWSPCYFGGVGGDGKPRAWVKQSYVWDEFTTTNPEGAP